MIKLLGFLCCFIPFLSIGQLNTTLVGHLNIPEMDFNNLNDVWGYVDETGVEYALVGATNGTYVISLEDPTNPVEVFFEPGQESIWRDLKVHGDYAYVTTEATDGLLIIDLSPLPAGPITTTVNFFGDGVVDFSTAHNLYMDENGIAYIFGANYGVGGAIMLDCTVDPLNPTIVGVFDEWYAHDGYVRNDTLYMGHITDGFFSIVDVTDKANPIVLNTQATTRTFTHNVWLSDDANTLYTTDELSDAFIESYDISDVNNIQFLDKIQSSPGENIVPHNTHVLGDYLVTSYYSDGLVIHDATHPNNLIEVANFDTYPGQTDGYEGCWGAYPFLPSGLMLATDRESGLYVIDVDFQQGAYLEGTVTDQTNAPIQDVRVTLQQTAEEANTIADGTYANGTLNSGTYDVEYFKIGYYSEFRTVDLSSGMITVQDVQMNAIPPYSLSINVYEEGTSTPIDNAQIKLEMPYLTHDGSTNALGNELMTLYYQDEYLISVGKWGYKQSCQTMQIDNTTNSINVYLSKGYYDDFTLDQGWVATGDAERGMWERAIPNPATIDAPQFDSEVDCSSYAFVTGNTFNQEYAFDNVVGGSTILISPIFDLTSYADPYVNYQTWFYNFFGDTEPNDQLRISIQNGVSSAILEDISFENGITNEWQWKSHRVSDFIAPTANMRLIIRTSDFESTWNVVEAGFDHFYVSEQETFANQEEMSSNPITLFPNPFNNQLTIQQADGQMLEVTALNGSKIKDVIVVGNDFVVDLSELESGMYLAKINNQTFRIVKDN